MPPSDPETAARELSEQLRQRARERDAINRAELDGSDEIAASSGPPDIGDALESMARSGFSMLATGIARLLILGGAAILILTGVAEIPVPFIEPVYGIGAIIAGVILSNATS